MMNKQAETADELIYDFIGDLEEKGFIVMSNGMDGAVLRDKIVKALKEFIPNLSREIEKIGQ